MPQPCEVILFDFFGTLVEYEPDRSRLGYPGSHELTVGWGAALTHDEFVREWDAATIELEDLATVTDEEFSMIDATEAFARRVALDLSPDQVHRLAARFLAEWQSHIKPVEGVAAMVGRLRLTHRLGIVSNTHDTAMIPAMLAAMAIDDAFETVVLSVDHGFRKPRASIYEAALGAIDSSPEVALFVGDSHVADYAGPRRLGMRALLIDPGGKHTVDPHDRISTVLDLERLL